MPIAGRGWKSGSTRTGGEAFPSPLAGEGAYDTKYRGRVRGLSPRRQTPHPSRCSLRSHLATLSHKGRGQERRTCPTPTTQSSAPSSRSIPPPTSRSRIFPTACSRPRTVWPRASGLRSAIMCSTFGSLRRIAGSMWSSPRCSPPRRSIRSWRWDQKSGRERARASANFCATTIRSCAITKSCVNARWCRWRMPNCICRSRSRATPISIRRRNTPPMSASCSAARTMHCSRTGCTCRSATTAALRPSWSPAPRCAGRAGN